MASYCSRALRVRGDDVNGQLLAGRQPGHRRLIHDKRLPHQTVFPKSRCSPKDGVPRKTVLAKRRGQESLRTIMPPSPLAAHGYGPTLLAGAEMLRLLKSDRIAVTPEVGSIYFMTKADAANVQR